MGIIQPRSNISGQDSIEVLAPFIDLTIEGIRFRVSVGEALGDEKGQQLIQTSEVSPLNIRERLEPLVHSLLQWGVELPPEIEFKFDYLEGQTDRSHAFSRKIVFDLEKNSGIATLCHELVHVALANLSYLGAYNDGYTFLNEGLACFLTEKIVGIQSGNYDYLQWASGVRIDGDEFIRSDGKEVSIEERLSYVLGTEVWREIDQECGFETIIDLVRLMQNPFLEQVPNQNEFNEIHKKVESGFVRLTGKNYQNWRDQVLRSADEYQDRLTQISTSFLFSSNYQGLGIKLTRPELNLNQASGLRLGGYFQYQFMNHHWKEEKGGFKRQSDVLMGTAGMGVELGLEEGLPIIPKWGVYPQTFFDAGAVYMLGHESVYIQDQDEGDWDYLKSESSKNLGAYYELGAEVMLFRNILKTPHLGPGIGFMLGYGYHGDTQGNNFSFGRASFAGVF